MGLTLTLRLSEIAALAASRALLDLSSYRFYTAEDGTVQIANKGTLDDPVVYSSNHVYLDGATQDVDLPIIYQLGTDSKQTATPGAGWTGNGGDSYSASNATSSLSDLSSSATTVLINFTVSNYSAGSVGGYSANGTYEVESTTEELAGVSFTGDVLINSVQEITTANSYANYFDVATKSIVSMDMASAPSRYYRQSDSFSQWFTTDTALTDADRAYIETHPWCIADLKKGTRTHPDLSFNGTNIVNYAPGNEGPLAGYAIALIGTEQAGRFYFKSTSSSQTYKFRAPSTESLTINGTVYAGNDGTSVVVSGLGYKSLEFMESTDGVLTYFSCNSNQITGSIPDLSSNTLLEEFKCNNNQITGSIPDLSSNTALTYFYCYINQITGSIPDLSSNTLLVNFYCNGNQITGSIPDLSSNTALTNFYCYSNQITGSIPDLSSNTSLLYFYCNDNQITGSIPDLSSNTLLERFYCYTNLITGSIPDLSGNTSLKEFKCNNNQITGSIPDLSSNTALTNFSCHINQITGSIPDLSSNTLLVNFYCNGNQITGFDGGTITVASSFYASDNALTQSAVDAILVALVNGGTTNAIITLEGGTNAAPSAIGEAAIDTLRTNGCTVTVTGGY
jgi:hypothetical protein